jgi:hypothetical protein
MSLVANEIKGDANLNDTLNLLVEKITGMERAINELQNGKTRGAKTKNKVVTYTRDEQKIRSIHVMPYEKGSDKVNICLMGVTADSSVALVISVTLDEFKDLAEKVDKTDVGKQLKIFKYKSEDTPALLIDDKWEIAA